MLSQSSLAKDADDLNRLLFRLFSATLVLGFTLRRARLLFRLGVAERVAGRRKRFAYRVKDGSLIFFSLAAFLHSHHPNFRAGC